MRDGAVKTPRYAWVVVFVILFSACAGPVNMFNVPPAASAIIPRYGIDTVAIGMRGSVFSFAAVVMAFPAGGLCDKLGLKKVVVISAGLTAAGSILACFSGNNYAFFLFCRVIIGLGFGLYQVAWPPLMGIWFPEKTRGTAMGIMGAYAGIGTIVDLNVIPRLLDYGYDLVLVLSAAWSVLALVVVCVMNLTPKVNFVEEEAKGKVMPKESSWADLLKTPTAWMIGIVFLIFAWICAGGVNTYYPVYLTEDFGIDAVTANAMVSVCSGLSVLSFAVGFTMDLTGKRKRWLIAFGLSYLLGVVLMYSMPTIPGVWAGIFFEGIACAGIPVCVRTLAVENLPPGMTNKALALITFCTTLGIAFGASLYALAADATSFKAAGLVMLGGLALVSVVCSFFIKEAKRKHDGELVDEPQEAVECDTTDELGCSAEGWE